MKEGFTVVISISHQGCVKKIPPKSQLWWFKLFLACPPAVKKEQLFIITHIISFHTEWKPRKQPYSQMPVKRGFSWEPLMASVSMISLNLKTVIKSLFRLHFSRLNKSHSLGFHHRADFSSLLIISVGFLWTLSCFYTIKSWPGLHKKEGIAWQPLNVILLHLYSLFFLPVWITLLIYLLSYTLFTCTSFSTLPWLLLHWHPTCFPEH